MLASARTIGHAVKVLSRLLIIASYITWTSLYNRYRNIPPPRSCSSTQRITLLPTTIGGTWFCAPRPLTDAGVFFVAALYLRRTCYTQSKRLLNRPTSSPIMERPFKPLYYGRRGLARLAALIGVFHGICNKGLTETHFTLHMAWLACLGWPFTYPTAANLQLVAIYIESHWRIIYTSKMAILID